MADGVVDVSNVNVSMFFILKYPKTLCQSNNTVYIYIYSYYMSLIKIGIFFTWGAKGSFFLNGIDLKMFAKIIHSARSFGTFPKFWINFLINLEVIKIFTSEVQKCTELHPLNNSYVNQAEPSKNSRDFYGRCSELTFLKEKLDHSFHPPFFGEGEHQKS